MVKGAPAVEGVARNALAVLRDTQSTTFVNPVNGLTYQIRNTEGGKVVEPKDREEYKKYVRDSTKYQAHDEANECGIGDLVTIVETREIRRLDRPGIRASIVGLSFPMGIVITAPRYGFPFHTLYASLRAMCARL